MVETWMTHEYQGRVIYCQHRLYIYSINRIVIYQGLFVEFSCNLHNNILLRNLLLVCYWCLSLVVATTIMKEIKIFSQNVYKNNLFTNIILKAQREFDIIFIQEPPWLFICSIPSSSSREGEELVGVLNHFNWIMFSRKSLSDYDSPKVISYINIRLSHF